MFKPFDIRKAERQWNTPTGSFSSTAGDEYLKLSFTSSSVDLLERLPAGSWNPLAFARASHQLLAETPLTTDVRRRGPVPPLGPDVRFKYTDAYAEIPARVKDGANLVVSLVAEGERVIGYGIAAVHPDHADIEIIDVDFCSSRSSGLQARIKIAQTEFTVGVGHIVVDLLTGALSLPIRVNATNPSSQYIFESLGFSRQSGTTNPCLLELTSRQAR